MADAGAQVLAHLAGDFRRMRQQRVEGAVAIEPFCGGLRTHLVDTRDVVGAVAHQREVVDDLFRIHVELRLDSGAIQQRVVHGVDQRDALIDQLRHVLVAGRDQHLLAARGGSGRQRADHVVGLDSGDAQQRQTHAGHRLQERLDLGAQVIGHRRTVGLVLGVQVIAEGLAGGVEDHRDARARVIAQQFIEHVEHAVHGAGRLAARTAQRRERVEGPVQVRGAVDQDQFRCRNHLAPSGAAV